MQKFKHLAKSTPLARMHSIHMCMHECTHTLTYCDANTRGFFHGWIRHFTNFWNFFFVHTFLFTVGKGIWKSVAH